MLFKDLLYRTSGTPESQQLTFLLKKHLHIKALLNLTKKQTPGRRYCNSPLEMSKLRLKLQSEAMIEPGYEWKSHYIFKFQILSTTPKWLPQKARQQSKELESL